jgi:hypothetical protein
VVLRCVIDDLLLPAVCGDRESVLIVFDGDESFILDAVEALYYELVAASDEERLIVQRNYRLLRTAADFRAAAA